MTAPSEVTSDHIFERGWRQGAILSQTMVQELQAGEYLRDVDAEADLVVVITQDCDLVHGSFDNEPVCEVLVMKPILKRESAIMYGKSPRKLHMELQPAGADAPRSFEALAHYKTHFPRQLLGIYFPCDRVSLPEKSMRGLREWLAKRYLRPALPNAFNDRLKPQQKPIEKLLKQRHDSVRGIYLMLNTNDELTDPDHEYKVEIIGEMFDEVYADEQKRAEGASLVLELADLLEKCPGIKATNHEVRPREEITLTDMEYLQLWDYDFISNEAMSK